MTVHLILHAFLFDADSTLVSIETLDEIIRVRLEEEEPAEAQRILAAIRRITDDGMEGRLDLQTSIAKRLEIGKVRRAHVERVRDALPAFITPGLRGIIASLRQSGHGVFAVSGGMRDCLLPALREIGFDDDHVFANDLLYGFDGSVLGTDPLNPLSRSGGKREIARSIRRNLPPQSALCMIGDGITDLEVFTGGDAERFIGFGLHKERTGIRERSPAYCTTLAEFTAHLLPFLR